MILSPRVFLILFLPILSLASLSSAHGIEGEAGACGAPVPGEYTLSTTSFAVLVALFMAGALLSAGLLRLRALSGFKRAWPAGVLLCIAVLVYYVSATPGYQPTIASFGEAGSAHYHANLLVFVNGESINLSEEKYMSTLSSPKSMLVHLHNGEGTVVHYHAPRVPLWYFIQSLGMHVNHSCLTVDGVSYCSNAERTLQLFVNGKRVQDISGFIAQDKHHLPNEDSLLLWYGPDNASAINAALSQVPNRACWYDHTCPLPDGFTLPPESCSG